MFYPFTYLTIVSHLNTTEPFSMTTLSAFQYNPSTDTVPYVLSPKFTASFNLTTNTIKANVSTFTPEFVLSFTVYTCSNILFLPKSSNAYKKHTQTSHAISAPLFFWASNTTFRTEFIFTMS